MFRVQGLCRDYVYDAWRISLFRYHMDVYTNRGLNIDTPILRSPSKGPPPHPPPKEAPPPIYGKLRIATSWSVILAMPSTQILFQLCCRFLLLLHALLIQQAPGLPQTWGLGFRASTKKIGLRLPCEPFGSHS